MGNAQNTAAIYNYRSIENTYVGVRLLFYPEPAEGLTLTFYLPRAFRHLD